MKPQSPSMSRRNVLQAAGISLALPWFETFAQAETTETEEAPPRRFCSIYFPFGVALQYGEYEGKPRIHADWSWFP